MQELEDAIATIRMLVKETGAAQDTKVMEHLLNRVNLMEYELEMLRVLHSTLLDVEVARNKLMEAR